MKCKCGNQLRESNNSVEAMLGMGKVHDFGYCDKCDVVYDISGGLLTKLDDYFKKWFVKYKL